MSSGLSSAAPSGPRAAQPLALPAWAHRLRPGVIAAGLVLAFFVIAVIAPSLLAGQSPYAINLSDTLRAPRFITCWGPISPGVTCSPGSSTARANRS